MLPSLLYVPTEEKARATSRLNVTRDALLELPFIFGRSRSNLRFFSRAGQGYYRFHFRPGRKLRVLSSKPDGYVFDNNLNKRIHDAQRRPWGAHRTETRVAVGPLSAVGPRTAFLGRF